MQMGNNSDLFKQLLEMQIKPSIIIEKVKYPRMDRHIESVFI